MADKKEETAEAAAAATEEKKTDSRIKILKNVPKTLQGEQTAKIDLSADNLKKLAGSNTVEVPRAEFIRNMWGSKLYTRSEITSMCRAFGDDPEMKYQIVFQATKGHEGGPAKQESAEGQTEAAA